MKRIGLLAAGAALGAISIGLFSHTWETLHARLASVPELSWLVPDRASGRPISSTERDHPDTDGMVKLSDQQVETAGIGLVEARADVLSRRLSVPGSIMPDGDRVARVGVKLLATVAELRKRVGESVRQNEVVALIESREVADAKSEYLAARVTDELQQTLYERTKKLWESKVSTENDFLRARQTAQVARNRLDVARAKLFALGMSEDQIAALPEQPISSLRLEELRAPIAGYVAERRVDLGALVGREGQESELFVIVDLSKLWVELAVPTVDLGSIHEGQELTIASAATGHKATATIIFISPLLDKETRTARVVASLDNPDQIWRPGFYVTAEIPVTRDTAGVVIPKTALQTVKGDRVVFVRTDDGFAKRKVVTGREDDRLMEIVSGLSTGEKVATSNSFVIKAELGKAEADDAD
jgi:cobalt-zinc-cadmium efflux system membrane fusion protein